MADQNHSEESALPPVGARILAFVLIALAGVCGALIGYAFVGLQYDGGSALPQAIGAIAGALIGSVGVGIVAVLAFHAMNEWTHIKNEGIETKRRHTR